MNPSTYRGYAFGECTLDLVEKCLLRNGQPVPLAPKVFDTLVLLVENAGHLVEKDEFMQKLWPDIYVGEDALARNISILRKSLGTTNGSPMEIVTVPTRGYRFESEVRKLNGEALESGDSPVAGATARAIRPETGAVSGVDGDALPGQHTGEVARRSWQRIAVFALLALAFGSCAGFVTFGLLWSPPQPSVISLARLTHSGRVDPWPGLVTDGVSIYYLDRQGDHWDLMRTSVSGGDSQPIATPFKNAAALDVSPDRSNLLIGSFDERQTRMPLWIWPVSGGAFRRVGDINGYAALWHPNGRQIVYSEDDGLYICDDDGTNARKFITTAEQPLTESWSPDGKLLRFVTVSESWEADANGKVLRRLPRAPDNLQNELDGAWSPDSRYFFLDYPVTNNRRDIWAIRKATTFFHPRMRLAVRLTNGPSSYEGMTPSKDPGKLFVVGVAGHTESVAYDPKSGRATPWLSGVCAANQVYSPNGQWIACESATGTILRTKPDGSERLVLADASLRGYDLKWSPDGKQIAFNSPPAGAGRGVIFLVPLAAGPPRQILNDGHADQGDPSWSPDGNFLAFSRANPDASSYSIWLLDLKTNQSSRVPGSEGMRYPAWSPDGRFLAAETEDWHKVMLYDFRSQHWTQLAEASVLNGDGITWSHDSKFLYFQDFLGKDEAVYQVRMDNRKVEVAASFETLLRNGAERVVFNGLAPDSSFLLSLDRGGSDIYALTLELP